VDSGWRGDTEATERGRCWDLRKSGGPVRHSGCEKRIWNRNGTAERGVRERRAKQVGAPISCEMVARTGAVINRNFLLIRYSFERLAKSFKRGELQRRWGGKVTIGETRSKTSFWVNGMRGVTRVVRAGQGDRSRVTGHPIGRCRGQFHMSGKRCQLNRSMRHHVVS